MSYLAPRNKFVAILTAFFILGWLCPAAVQGAELKLESPSYILMEPVSGEVVLEKNSHQRVEPASVTKLMTMVLAVEALKSGQVKLTDQVVTSENAWKMGGAQIYLEPGEQMTFQDLLASIAVGSANDSCVAVAEHLYGSQEEFVRMMNQKAEELGMKDTQYVNCHGLHAEGHYTSAYDQALLSRYAVKIPELLEFTSIKEYKIRNGKMQLYNHNKMLWWYPGSDGLKTGWHNQANYCLASSAVRDGMRLITVTLGAPQPRGNFRDSIKLLNLGSSKYSYKKLVEPGQGFGYLTVKKGKVDRVEAVAAEEKGLLLTKGKEGAITTRLELPMSINAPVSEGQKLGELVIMQQKDEIARVELVAAQYVEKADFGDYLRRFIRDTVKMF